MMALRCVMAAAAMFTVLVDGDFSWRRVVRDVALVAFAAAMVLA